MTKHDENVLGVEYTEQALDASFRDEMQVDGFSADTRRHCEMVVDM